MRLIIAEKPSLARAIAAALPGQSRRIANHIQCSTGDVVAWCAGHVLEMAPPEDYSESLQTWSLDTLPIVPQNWKHRVSARELVESLAQLLAKASRVVHAGDPDREGQLLVDEVLAYLGWNGPTDRLLVTDLRPAAIASALGALEPNARFVGLCESALARQRADWLYGLNLTRLYTLRAGLAGYRDVVSVGRVQTPLLGLIVRRDRDIEAFVSKPFFGVAAVLRTASGAEFEAQWAVGEEHAAVLDAEGRLLDHELATRVASAVRGRPGRVTLHDDKPVADEAPLPYSLATLQIDAGRKLGLSAARVLEVAQTLYERQLLTYPRSDCQHLPAAHRHQAPEVLAAVRENAPGLTDACAAADTCRQGRAWDDSKVTAHHAIIPTAKGGGTGLDETERALYELVARRYVQQFLAAWRYLQTRVEIRIDRELFVARGRRTLAAGWKAVDDATSRLNDAADVEENEESSDDTPLPTLALGQALTCSSARLLEKRTQPPKAFTDASLIQAMCNVARFVTDPKAKKILHETDGIGTPATRASIIETLFKRRYIERRKRQIRSTPVGRALVAALPSIATTPDMTAVWEFHIGKVHDRQLGLERFLGAVRAQVDELVARGKVAGPLVLPELVRSTRPPPAGSRPPKLRKAPGRPRREPGAPRAPRGAPQS